MHCEKYIRYCLLSRHNINSILFSVSSKYIVLWTRSSDLGIAGRSRGLDSSWYKWKTLTNSNVILVHAACLMIYVPKAGQKLYMVEYVVILYRFAFEPEKFISYWSIKDSSM